jgi:hypothetical protein
MLDAPTPTARSRSSSREPPPSAQVNRALQDLDELRNDMACVKDALKALAVMIKESPGAEPYLAACEKF